MHDLGRASVPNRVWEHPGPLRSAAQERVGLHAYHSERGLARCGPLAPLARLAGTHHERLDGSGYHRSETATGLGPAERLLAAADKADRHDRALWTAPAKATGAGGNSTALVGTPETVARALLDYVDIGVPTILIRGYDPLDDAVDYGRELIPLVREEVARRDAAAVSPELVGAAR